MAKTVAIARRKDSPGEASPHGKPFVFFDLGETLVGLGPLLDCLAALVEERIPSKEDARQMAQQWILTSASEMPRDSKSVFVTEHRIASAVLARLLASSGVRIDDNEAGLMLRTAWDRYETVVRLAPDVSREWLADVRRLASRVGVVTDGDTENVNRLLDRLALRPYFDSVTMSETVQVYKPNPRIYQAAMDSLFAEPSKSIFVSDAPLDLMGADAVGMATAIVHRGSLSERGSVPSNVIRLRSLRDLLGVLRQFAQTGRFEGP